MTALTWWLGTTQQTYFYFLMVIVHLALGFALMIPFLAFGLVHLSVARLPIAMILGVMVLVGGGVSWMRTGDKLSVTAATAVTLVGALQVLSSVHLR